METLLHEPLLHFLVIGVALFVLSAFMDDPVARNADQIVVTTQHIERLANMWQRTWQRPPTPYGGTPARVSRCASAA